MVKVTSPLQPQLGAYQACLEGSLAQWPNLIKRWSEKLLAALKQRSLFEAAEQLEQHQDWISHRFVAALVQEIAEDADGLTVQLQHSNSVNLLDASALMAVSFEQLEIMPTEKLREVINLARLEHLAFTLSKSQLVTFTALFSSAQGLNEVSLARNPFRPQVVVRVLLRLIQSLALDTEVRAQWCLHGAPLLGYELRTLYRLLAQLLQGYGVMPASHALTERLPKHLAEQFELAFHVAPMPACLTLSALHHVLTGPLAEQGLGYAVAAASEAARLWVQSMACDERLLLPIRQAIVGFAPVLKQLALTERRFFSQRRHPARRLLLAMTHHSLAYASTHSPGFAGFMQDVHQVNTALAHAPSTDVTAWLSELFTAFEAKQRQRDAKSEQAQDQAVNVLLNVEARNVLARKIAAHIQARPDFLAGNRVITHFLAGPWAQVLAHEQLSQQQLKTDEAPTEGVFSSTLTDLLWSMNVESAAKHRRRLVTLIPDLLERLRAGLALIGYPLERASGFFEVVMFLHHSALDSLRASKPKLGTPSPDVTLDPSEPWLMPAEALQVNLLQVALLRGEHNPVAFCDLPLGAWIEFIQEGKVKRAQLSWVSPHKLFLLFTGAAGQIYSTTQRTLHNLQAAGFLKVISQTSVVDDALDTLVHTAIRNTVDAVRKTP